MATSQQKLWLRIGRIFEAEAHGVIPVGLLAVVVVILLLMIWGR